MKIKQKSYKQHYRVFYYSVTTRKQMAWVGHLLDQLHRIAVMKNIRERIDNLRKQS